MYTDHLIFDVLRTPSAPQSRLWESPNLDPFQPTDVEAGGELSVFDIEFRNNLFRKADDWAVEEIDARMLADFLTWEGRTHMVTKKLLSAGPEGKTATMARFISEFFHRVFGHFSIEDCDPRATHGATVVTPRDTHPFFHVGVQRVVESELAHALRAQGVHDPLVFEEELSDAPLVDAPSNLLLVPKTWDQRRVIFTSTRHKQMWQSAIGDWMTRALRIVDYDPETDPDKHRAWARVGSLSGGFCTIDLTHASDSIGLYWLNLLPSDLRKWLLLTRDAKCTLPDGRVHVLAMLGGSGNGWTFPFETALFYAICFACVRFVAPQIDAWRYVRDHVSVFGDDIIIADTSIAKEVFNALHGLGFVPNERKSYLTGPRRESCGADYVNGIPHRSFYAKKRPDSIQDWIRFANGIRRTCYYDGDWRNGRNGYYAQLWILCVRRVHELIRSSEFAGVYSGDVPCGPSWLGDSVVGITDEWNRPINGFPGDYHVPCGCVVPDISLAYTYSRRVGHILTLAERAPIVGAFSVEQTRRVARMPWNHAVRGILMDPQQSRSYKPYVINEKYLRDPEGSLSRDTIEKKGKGMYPYILSVPMNQTRFIEGDLDSLFESLPTVQRMYLSRANIRSMMASDVCALYDGVVSGNNLAALSGFHRPTAAQLAVGQDLRWAVASTANMWD